MGRKSFIDIQKKIKLHILAVNKHENWLSMHQHYRWLHEWAHFSA
jgi:hypothetical protein